MTCLYHQLQRQYEMQTKEILDLYNQIEQLYKEIDTINHKLALHVNHKTPSNNEQKRFDS